MSIVLPQNEIERLKALDDCQILDSAPEEAFDKIDPQRKQQQQRYFFKKTVGGISLLLLLMIGIGFTFYWSTSQFSDNQKQISHTFEIITTLDNIERGIKQTSSIALGKVNLKQDYSLQEYDDEAILVQQRIQTLSQLISDNTLQQQRVETLRSLVANEFAYERQIISREQNFPSATNLATVQYMNKLQEPILSLVAAMEETEQSLLTTRIAAAKTSSQTIMLVNASAIFMIILIGVIIYHLVSREIKRLRLIENNLDFTDAILNTPGAIVVVVNSRGKIIQFNQACEQVTGYSLNELVGKDFPEIFQLSEEAYLALAINYRSKATQGFYRYDSQYLTKEGQLRSINWSSSAILNSQGEIVNIVHTGIDITERRRAEIALETQREWLEITLSSIGDAVVATDDKGNITLMNPVAEALTGWTAKESIGRKVHEVVKLINVKIHQSLEGPFERTLKEKIVMGLSKDTALVARNGKIIPIEDSCSPILHANGEIEGAVMVFRDITHQKQWEEKIQEALYKEKELSELKSKFISLASHEFRTPLTTILSSTELLEISSHKWTEERKLKHFNQIKNSVDRMNRMLSDVLLLGKAESGSLVFNPQLLDLAQFCQDLVEEIQQGVGNSHTICFTTEGNLSDIYMDQVLLRHILSNLLSNAIKYSPKGGSVNFSLNHNYNANSDKPEVVLRVQDSGIGIPADELPRLFSRFHRANNVGNIPGTGLGLSIVKTSVELHSGSINVISELEVGTTFIVSFPLN